MTLTPPKAASDRLIGPPPRELDWAQFDAETRRYVKQGNHQLFVGPTGTGKTVLCRMNVRHRGYVVVWGTKIRDDSLDAYVDEGYVRVDEWPPTTCLERKPTRANPRRLVRRDYKLRPDADGQVHLILWPEIKRRTDIEKHHDLFLRCLDDVFTNGSWTIVVDEALWVTSRIGLDLDKQLSVIAYQGRSNKVTLYLCMQRPSNMSRIIWSSVSDAYIFKSGITDDIRELASLSTAEPRDAVTVMRTRIRGHQFLHIPTRGDGPGWGISEVDPRVI